MCKNVSYKIKDRYRDRAVCTEGHGKTSWQKNLRNKEGVIHATRVEGWPMQRGGQSVYATTQVSIADFEYLSPSGNILPCLLLLY